MKKMLGVLVLVGVMVCFALPALGKQPQGRAQLSFSGQEMPRVEFSHDAHKGYISDCKECHHMGVGTGTCVDCHGGDKRARSKKSAFHDSCQGCHTKQRVADRKDCNFCHKK